MDEISTVECKLFCCCCNVVDTKDFLPATRKNPKMGRGGPFLLGWGGRGIGRGRGFPTRLIITVVKICRNVFLCFSLPLSIL
jgi:hypothetical protein